MRRAGSRMLGGARAASAAAVLLLCAQSALGGEAGNGPYRFSDEQGGFVVLGVTGTGTAADPFTVRQELRSATPATLTIRAAAPVRPFGSPGVAANGFLHLRLLLRNASGQPWLACEFELQEVLDVASTFGDGLSFDQRRTDSETVASSGFARYSRDFEPYDRLLFTEGVIDPGETAEFRFLVTDFTPRATFYLVQDPRIPSS